MSEITKEEINIFHNFCEDIMASPSDYQNIYKNYVSENSSFDYLFLLQRVKMSVSYGSKQLLKTIKEVKMEIRTAQLLMQQAEKLRAQKPYSITQRVNDIIARRNAQEPGMELLDFIEPADPQPANIDDFIDGQ